MSQTATYAVWHFMPQQHSPTPSHLAATTTPRRPRIKYASLLIRRRLLRSRRFSLSASQCRSLPSPPPPWKPSSPSSVSPQAFLPTPLPPSNPPLGVARMGEMAKVVRADLGGVTADTGTMERDSRSVRSKAILLVSVEILEGVCAALILLPGCPENERTLFPN